MTQQIKPDQAQKRMLVIRLSALGDVAMSLPVIYSLAKQYPHLHIDLLTRPFFASMVINPPANLHVIKADYKSSHKGAGGTLRLLRTLSANRYDMVADLHNVLRSWVIDGWMRLHGVKVAMVDKQRSDRRRLLKGRSGVGWSFIDRYCSVFRQLGYPVELSFRSLYPLRPQPPVPVPEGSVGIAPFARFANKTYPIELMKRVVELLSSQGTPIFLFGARGREAQMLQEIAATLPGVTSLAGTMSLDEELRTMASLKCMVSMDSANQHLASLTGTPVVTLWGSTTPRCGFMPYGQNPRTSLVAALDCQPCSIAGGFDCPLGTYACLRSITPEQVVEKVNAI